MGKQRLYFLALAVWLLLFVVAFSLAAVRELLIAPAIGEPWAHVVGTLAFVRRIRLTGLRLPLPWVYVCVARP